MFARAIDARPTRFGGAPRVWEKPKAALEAGTAAVPDELTEAWKQADARVFSVIPAGL